VESDKTYQKRRREEDQRHKKNKAFEILRAFAESHGWVRMPGEFSFVRGEEKIDILEILNKFE
jgi:ribosome biogenesis GTPase A